MNYLLSCLDVLAQMLILFAVSSTINLCGIVASYLSYGGPFVTFNSRLGMRTLLCHLSIIMIRVRDPYIFEHVCNIGILVTLCVSWTGAAI
jgi:hypothetical protein